MKYLDTNVLIRIITGDDPAKATAALAEIERGGRSSFNIIDAVLVEVCFTLEFHAYAMARSDIVAALATLTAAPQIAISMVSRQALALYGRYPKLDYVDCLLFVLGGKNGVLTFDKNLQKSLLT